MSLAMRSIALLLLTAQPAAAVHDVCGSDDPTCSSDEVALLQSKDTVATVQQHMRAASSGETEVSAKPKGNVSAPDELSQALKDGGYDSTEDARKGKSSMQGKLDALNKIVGKMSPKMAMHNKDLVTSADMAKITGGNVDDHGCSGPNCVQGDEMGVNHSQLLLLEEKSQGKSKYVAAGLAISPGGVINGPVALAALLTLTVIGPDHLATLVSLCVSKRGWEAFNIGTAWGVGHTLGIMTIVPILIISQAWFGTGATQELWERFGNYIIGVMMVCCGMYFLIFQSKYFVQKEDGTYAAQACTCCQQSYVFEASREQEEGHADDASASTNDAGERDPPCLPRERGEHHPGKNGKTLFCNTFGRPRPLALSTSRKGVESETTPLIMGSDKKGDVENASSSSGQADFWARFFGNRGLESIVIGLLQGFCCPSGLQSMIILTHISKNFSAPATLFFALTFYVGSVVGSGLVTFFIAEFTQLGLGAFVSAKSVYIGCCAFTICLGITWIIMNATGILESTE